jgi:hypothetical protein
VTVASLERCYICDRQCLAERDHFPVPESLGGTLVMPICKTCHDMKDRVPLADWCPSDAFAALAGVWNRASASERLVLAKMISAAAQGMAAKGGYSGKRNKRKAKDA